MELMFHWDLSSKFFYHVSKKVQCDITDTVFLTAQENSAYPMKITVLQVLSFLVQKINIFLVASQ